MLIEQDGIDVQQYYKTGNKQWTLQGYDQEDRAMALKTFPFEISLQDIYSKVNFELVESSVESLGV